MSLARTGGGLSAKASDEACSLSPLARAARVYRSEWCRNTFEEDLAWHLENGYVLSTPEAFLMGYPESDEEHGRYWHVSLMAGHIMAAITLTPYYLPWLAFERRNVLKFYRTDRLYAKLTGSHF